MNEDEKKAAKVLLEKFQADLSAAELLTLANAYRELTQAAENRAIAERTTSGKQRSS